MKKRIFAIILAVITVSSAFSLFACSDTPSENDVADITKATDESTAATEVESDTDGPLDDLPELDFNNDSFNITTFENENFHKDFIIHEMNGEIMNDAQYIATQTIEERFNVQLVQNIVADNLISGMVTQTAMSGDDMFHIATIRCTDALTHWQKGNTLTWENIPNVNLSKPYWDQLINKSLTLNNIQYVATGSFNITTYYISYVLLFNKAMRNNFSLDDPYELVNNGKWTFDAMNTMMNAVTSDIDGNGEMTKDDRYGFVCHYKQALPDFWISAGEMSIKKDENDTPYFAMGEERFVEVCTKVFEILQDTGSWFKHSDVTPDVPRSSVDIFTNDRALFMDTSLFFIDNMREMETDFGIIPYPKFDEAQSDYYSRVSYYIPSVVPVTNTKLEMTGAIVEALHAESYKTVIPAYYDIILMQRNSRDEESQAMLELIFNSFVIDIGDTTLCADIRDNFVSRMFNENKRDIASTVAKYTKSITKKLEKMPVVNG